MASDAITPTRMQHLKGDRHFFSSSDDNAMMKQILATHAPDGRDFEVRLVLDLIEEVLRQAPLPGIVSEPPKKDALDKDLQVTLSDMLEVLAYTINKICCEISCKCSGGDAHQTTVAIFNMLTNYSWDAKVMLALAAFTVNYGEFWMMAQLYPTNKLARSVALVKQFPNMAEHAETLKPKFDALNNLIKVMLDIAKCILEFKELPSQYINPDMPEMITASANIPIAVYWTIRSIVACASQIMGLIGMGHEYIASATEAWELSSFVQKLSTRHSHLTKQLNLCYEHIDEKKQIEAYKTLVNLFKTPHMDNMRIISALINHKDDLLPVFDGATKRRVSIDILRMKHVLLLITDLDFTIEEFSLLEQIYTESRQPEMRPESQYEVVWLPVVDRSSPWTEEKQRTFESFQNTMPWYSVHRPSLLNLAAIKYIKEVWRFNKKPLLVVLDPRGSVVNPNALHMMWIWGNTAFPFTTAREESLWKGETWKIELLIDSIEPAIFNWISERKYICLYGGEDIDWIRKFTRKLRDAARASNIEMEMLYMGKSNPREKVRKNSAAIAGERLSHTVPDQNLIWFFWERLESMWHSKVQHGRTVEEDPIMQEIMTMMTYDGSEQGWAVISSGGAEGTRMVMAKAKGDTILPCLEDFEAWKDEVPAKGFVPAMETHLELLRTPHHCNRLILPGTSGSIPDRIVCAECGRAMEKFIMYRCCTD